MSEGRKDDQGKLRWDLLPLELIEQVVKVYTFGASHYGENTWQNLDNGYNRFKAAMFRHLMAHEKGEVVDGESGISHLAHVVWNAMAMMHFSEKKLMDVYKEFVDNGAVMCVSDEEPKDLFPQIGQKVACWVELYGCRVYVEGVVEELEASPDGGYFTIRSVIDSVSHTYKVHPSQITKIIE